MSFRWFFVVENIITHFIPTIPIVFCTAVAYMLVRCLLCLLVALPYTHVGLLLSLLCYYARVTSLHDGLAQRPIRPLRHFIDYKQYKCSLLGQHQTSRLPRFSSAIFLCAGSRISSAITALSNDSGVSGSGGSKT